MNLFEEFEWDEEEFDEKPLELLGFSRIDGYPILKRKRDTNDDFWYKLEKFWFYDVKIRCNFVNVPEWNNYKDYHIIKIYCPKERVIEYFNLKSIKNVWLNDVY